MLTQNGVETGTAVSGSDGLVNFGILAAGTYQLTETIAPSGFQQNSTVYQVVIGMLSSERMALSDICSKVMKNVLS